MSTTRVMILACIGALGLSAAPCLAQDVQTKRELVRFTDLDVGTQAGAEALLSRLAAAAERVCTLDGETKWTYGLSAARHDCMADAMTDAVHDVHSSTVKDAYSAWRSRLVRLASAQVSPSPQKP